MTWQDIPLAQLADVRSGGGAPQSEDAFSDQGLPFVRAGSLVKLLSGKPETELERIRPDVARLHGLKPFPAGTVLFAKSGMSATKGHIYALRHEAYVVNHLAALVPRRPSDSAFLTHALQRFSPTALIKDPAYPSIRLGDIEEMTIRAPRESDERERIATILDQAEVLRRKRRKGLELLDELPSKLFDEMFGDLIENNRNWPIFPVRHFVEKFESGKNLVSDDQDDPDASFRVLKVSAVTSLRFKSDQSKALPAHYTPPTHHVVRRGDLLFSRANTSELIGATAFVDEDVNDLAMPDKIWRFVWHAEKKAEPFFVWFLFRQQSFRNLIARRATGTSGSMKNISQDKVLDIEVGLPSLLAQDAFARHASEIMKIRRQSESQAFQLDGLFSSLQYRAFRGKL